LVNGEVKQQNIWYIINSEQYYLTLLIT